MNWIKGFIDGWNSVKPTHDDWGFRLMILFYLVIGLCTLAMVWFA